MTERATVERAWHDFASFALTFYTCGDGAETARSDRWFAALSRTSTTELNVCGLLPRASAADAGELLRVLGTEQPVLVFTSEHASDDARSLLVADGLEVSETVEPLMWCPRRPTATSSSFTVERAETDDEVATAMALAASAHQVDEALLLGTLGEAAKRGSTQPWVARDGAQPVSTAWLCTSGTSIGVMEMMTPARYQGRGAGRALLTAALGASWRPETEGAVLLSTPAGRRLYESVGFTMADASTTHGRGFDDATLAAIGQPR